MERSPDGALSPQQGNREEVEEVAGGVDGSEGRDGTEHEHGNGDGPQPRGWKGLERGDTAGDGVLGERRAHWDRVRWEMRAARARAYAVTRRSPTVPAASSSAQRSRRYVTVERTGTRRGLAAAARPTAVDRTEWRWVRWARSWARRTRRSAGLRALSMEAVTRILPGLPGMAKARGIGEAATINSVSGGCPSHRPRSARREAWWLRRARETR